MKFKGVLRPKNAAPPTSPPHSSGAGESVVVESAVTAVSVSPFEAVIPATPTPTPEPPPQPAPAAIPARELVPQPVAVIVREEIPPIPKTAVAPILFSVSPSPSPAQKEMQSLAVEASLATIPPWKPEQGPTSAPNGAATNSQADASSAGTTPTSAAATPVAQEPQREFRRPPRKRMVIFGPSTAIFLVVCGFGYYKYDEYLKRPPPPPKPVASAKGISASANPLNALKEAKSILDKADASRKSAYNTVAAMDDSVGAHAPGSAAPAQAINYAVGPIVVQRQPAVAPPASAAPKELVLVTTTNPNPATLTTNRIAAAAPSETTPEPSAAFARWAQRLQIRGMRFGDAPRVFIGATSYHIGDLVNPQLGIKFDDYDPATRLLRFKDRTGAVVEIHH